VDTRRVLTIDEWVDMTPEVH